MSGPRRGPSPRPRWCPSRVASAVRCCLWFPPPLGCRKPQRVSDKRPSFSSKSVPMLLTQPSHLKQRFVPLRGLEEEPGSREQMPRLQEEWPIFTKAGLFPRPPINNHASKLHPTSSVETAVAVLPLCGVATNTQWAGAQGRGWQALPCCRAPVVVQGERPAPRPLSTHAAPEGC